MYFKQFQKNDYARLAMVNGAILAHHTGLGKSWAAYTWPILKVGYTKSTQNGRTVLTPSAPILIVSPGDLHQQLICEGERHFKVHTTRLDSKETFLRLSTLDASGRRQLPPGFYITSYTQLGVNGVLKMPDLDTTPTADKLMNILPNSESGSNSAAVRQASPEAKNGLNWPRPYCQRHGSPTDAGSGRRLRIQRSSNPGRPNRNAGRRFV